jgi:hypothetical protein
MVRDAGRQEHARLRSEVDHVALAQRSKDDGDGGLRIDAVDQLRSHVPGSELSKPHDAIGPSQIYQVSIADARQNRQTLLHAVGHDRLHEGGRALNIMNLV